MNEVFALPAVVVDRHIRLAGSAQLKVLLWLSRIGKGIFDAEACGRAIGQSPADCTDALHYWIETGLLHIIGESERPQNRPSVPAPSAPPAFSAPAVSAPALPSAPTPRPQAVKPQMKEVLARQKESAEFRYLLDTTSSRLGRAITHGDMETLLYLFDTAGMPIEVILMVIEYAVAAGKPHMRYVEKVALDWSDKGIDTISAAEQHLCRLDRRNQAWSQVQALLNISQSPTVGQSDAAEKWICDWHMSDDLILLANQQCVEKIGKFNCSYVSKILEHWYLDGIDTLEKALATQTRTKKKKSANAPSESSLDLDEYEKMVMSYIPVYKKEK